MTLQPNRAPSQAEAMGGGTQPAGRVSSWLLIGRLWPFDYATLVSAISFALLFFDAPHWIYFLQPTIPPKLTYAAISCACLPAALAGLFCRSRQHFSAFEWLLAVWITTNAAALLYASGAPTEVEQVLIARVMSGSVVALVLRLLAQTENHALGFVLPLVATALPASVVLQFMAPASFESLSGYYSVPGRASGPFANANSAADAMNLSLLLAMPAIPRALRLPALLLTGIAILFTFSRFGLLVWLLIVLGLAHFRKIPRAPIIVTILVVTGTFGALANQFIDYLHSRTDLEGTEGNLIERIESLARGNFDTDSDTSRFEAAADALNRIKTNIFFGHGLGTAHAFGLGQQIAPHNQFLALGIELGVLGMMLVALLLGCVATGNYFRNRNLQLLTAWALLLYCFASHNLLDLSYWLLGAGVAAQSTAWPALLRRTDKLSSRGRMPGTSSAT